MSDAAVGGPFALEARDLLPEDETPGLENALDR
jgi:hypothetical protein